MVDHCVSSCEEGRLLPRSAGGGEELDLAWWVIPAVTVHGSLKKQQTKQETKEQEIYVSIFGQWLATNDEISNLMKST